MTSPKETLRLLKEVAKMAPHAVKGNLDGRTPNGIIQEAIDLFEDLSQSLEIVAADRDAKVSLCVNLRAYITALEAENTRLREALIERDGGRHDPDCKSQWSHSGYKYLCNCGHDEVLTALSQDGSA